MTERVKDHLFQMLFFHQFALRDQLWSAGALAGPKALRLFPGNALQEAGGHAAGGADAAAPRTGVPGAGDGPVLRCGCLPLGINFCFQTLQKN